MFNRRDFLRLAGASAGIVTLGGCAGIAENLAATWSWSAAVSGRHGGQIHLRMWSQGSVEVTLVERDTAFISCPISNLGCLPARRRWPTSPSATRA